VTEAEAKTRWCPMVRRPYYGTNADGDEIGITSVNSEPAALDLEPEHNCIASSCMMWRWETRYSQDKPADDPRYPDSRNIDSGYCGLAGKP
jgi:hypothetical protein